MIDFEINDLSYAARVISKRPAAEDPHRGLTHLLEYIEGDSGREWVCLNEARQLMRDQYGHDAVPYEVRALADGAEGTPPRTLVSRGTVRGDVDLMEQVRERIHVLDKFSTSMDKDILLSGLRSKRRESKMWVDTGRGERKWWNCLSSVTFVRMAVYAVVTITVVACIGMYIVQEVCMQLQQALFDELGADTQHRDVEELRKDLRRLNIGTRVGSAAVCIVMVMVSMVASRLLAAYVAAPMHDTSRVLRQLAALPGQELHRVQSDMHASPLKEVNELGNAMCSMLESVHMFSRYIPKTVVKGIVGGDERTRKLHVDRREVTIMFSDLQDFTTISESVPQMDLLFILTRYLSLMTPIIESYEGVVAEIMGDGLLVFFNTPDDVQNHAAKACASVLVQQEVLNSVLNPELGMLELPQLVLRVGVHTGMVLSGTLGSSTRMKFGCLGDPVNLASRLEGLCKVYGVSAMCSGMTVDSVGRDTELFFRQLDLVQVKGKNTPTRVYEVMGLHPHREVSNRSITSAETSSSFRNHMISATTTTSCKNDQGDAVTPELPTAESLSGSMHKVATGTSEELQTLDLPRAPRPHVAYNLPGEGSGSCEKDRSSRNTLNSMGSELVKGLDCLPAAIRKYAARYEEALLAYQEASFAKAAALSEACVRERPEDRAAQRLHERAERCERLGLSEAERGEWSGVTIMNEK